MFWHRPAGLLTAAEDGPPRRAARAELPPLKNTEQRFVQAKHPRAMHNAPGSETGLGTGRPGEVAGPVRSARPRNTDNLNGTRD